MTLPGDATIASSTAILKTKYNQSKVYWMAYKNNPDYATVKKKTDFDGNNKVIAVQTEVPTGGGSSISQAQSNMNPGSYQKFTITRIEDFGVARVKGQAIKAAAKNTGALVDLWTREMDGILHHVVRSTAINMWRTGTGTRGFQGSAVSGTTITLSDGVSANRPSDITNFAIGLKIQATNGDGGAVRIGGQGYAYIASLSRVQGTMTVSGTVGGAIVAINTLITDIVIQDALVRAGDYVGAQVSGANTMITGIGGWIQPIAKRPLASPTTLWGLDQSTDEVRLGGLYLDGKNVSMQETLLEGLAMLGVENAGFMSSDPVVWMHPRDRMTLVKELDAKVQYTRVDTSVPGSEARVGFRALEIEADNGTSKVMSSLNVPRGTVFITYWETWALESLGPMPGILDFDSNKFLRVTDDDAYEVRVGGYPQMSCESPVGTLNVSNFGA